MHSARRATWSWAFIDWANSAFAIVIMTAMFPIYFKSYLCDVPGMTPDKSTAYWGFANSIASAIIAVLAPVLGSIADQGNAKKKFLLTFTVLGAAATAALPLAAQGEYVLAAALYAIAAIGFSGNNLFTDALLTDVAEPKTYDRVSALAYSLGYIGSGGLFVFCSVMFQSPESFGLGSGTAALHASFWLTAVWWLVFTLPAVFWIRETPGTPAVGGGGLVSRSFRQLGATLRAARGDSRVLIFLGAYVLYIDGVNTVIKMATTFGLSIGLDQASLIKALLVTQFVACPAALLFGRIGEKFGARRGITIGVVVYILVCIFATRMDTADEFFAMAVVIGLVQGGVQALSRSYFARLIPAERGGEYFGLYNMVGKFAAILGPALMAGAALLTDTRTSILALIVLFGGGLALLSRLRD